MKWEEPRMNYEFRELSFPSSDGVHKIYAEIYIPRSGEIRGIVQLAHGMVDHVGRYKLLADYLTGEGFVFAGNHHLGHGRSVTDKDDFGFFAKKGGVDLVLGDLNRMNSLLKEEYPNLPLVLLGHSMGSFIARLYTERYPDTVDAVIIHGTAGPNPLLPFGRALSFAVKHLHSTHHRSALINSLAFGAYNSAFPKSEGVRAWLSRDKALADETDEYTDFIFTASAYSDLFKMLASSNSRRWYKHYPKSMPTLIVSGTDDPVGGKNAKGPRYVYKHLKSAGVDRLSIKLYDGARHELFRETNREEVFYDLTEWIKANITRA